MSDLRVINILQSQNVPGIQQTSVPNYKASTNIPGGVVIGSVLQGFIINRDASGNPILRTEQGDVTFESKIFLKIGSEVSIRIENTGGNVAARLLSINGLAPELAAQQHTSDPDVVISGHLTDQVDNNSNTKTSQPTNAGQAEGSTQTTATAAASPPTASASPRILLQGYVLNTPTENDAPRAVQVMPGSLVKLFISNIQQPQTAAPAIPQQAATAAPTVNTATPTPSTSQAPQTAPTVFPVSPTTANTGAATANTPPAPNTAKPPQLLVGNAGTNAPQATSASSPQSQASTPQAAVPATPAAPLPFIQADAVDAFIATNNVLAGYSQQPSGARSTLPNTSLPGTTQPVGSNTQSFQAVVVSGSPNGESIIKTPLGLIRITAETPLAEGSVLELVLDSVQDADQLTPSATILPNQSQSATQLARSWPNLQSIFTLLLGSQNQDGVDIDSITLPTVLNTPLSARAEDNRNQILPGLMGFIASLRSNDFKSWLGKHNANWLEKHGFTDLLQGAEGEFRTLARQFTEPNIGGWQSLFFPTFIGGEIQQTRLFVKRDKKDPDGNKRKKDDDTRFVVEMELSQLGAIQMDGFVRRRESAVSFDLIIRSHDGLNKDMEQEITRIYTQTGELTGYQGNVIFQKVKEFPINPLEEITHSVSQGIVA
jgi:hypothetical protein